MTFRLKDLSNYVMCMFGGVLFAVGLNVFVVPINLYMGNVTGIAQVIQSLVNMVLNAQVNITGWVILLINLPLLYVAYRILSRVFFLKTVATIASLTLALSFVPIPAEPLMTDRLTLSVIGGIVCGVGGGITLRYGGSGGGVDILGVYFTMRRPGMSVGKLTLFIGTFVFVYCLFVFTFEVVVYSVIFTLVCAQVMDRFYAQNIKVCVLAITKKPEHWVYINNELKRGATVWKGIGAYSNETVYVIFSVVSKYELPIFRRYLRDKDPESFMVSWDQVQVTGRFDSHLFF